MFKISVCMIVKNEEKHLERILKCAEQFADEIIIVDTGSTDNTIEIANKHTKKVYNFDWCDDFSKARNFSFSKATCDYQMWLDADDFITDANIKKIKSLKKSPLDIDVYMFNYEVGFDENDQPTLVYERERLLKRENHYIWQGFVHEVIVPSGKISHESISIQHRKTEFTNPERNLKLYKKHKKIQQFTPREQYYYAKELFYTNHISSAITNLTKFLKMQGYEMDNFDAYITLCRCHLLQNNLQKAENTLHKCLTKHLPTKELLCLFGQLFDLKQMPKKAIFYYELALKIPSQKKGFISIPHEKLIPHIELSKLYYYQNNYNEAKFHHQKAKKLAPKHKVVLYNDKFFQD